MVRSQLVLAASIRFWGSWTKIERRSRDRNPLASRAWRRRGSDVHATSSHASGSWIAASTVAETAAVQSSRSDDRRRISAILLWPLTTLRTAYPAGWPLFSNSQQV